MARTGFSRGLRRLLVPLLPAAAILSGCGSDSEPAGPELPPDTTTYEEQRGQLIVRGVRAETNGLTGPNWTFLGDSDRIAFVTGTGVVGEGGLWYRNLEEATSVQIMDGLDVIQELHYAAEEGRIYLGQWQRLISVEPDGAEPVTHETDVRGGFRVSPDGRHLLIRRASDDRILLVDRTAGDTTQVDFELHVTRMFNRHAVFPFQDGASGPGVGVADFATHDVLTASGMGSFLPTRFLGVGGPPTSPWLAALEFGQDGADVVTFVGNPATGTGVSAYVLHIPGDSIYSSPWDAVQIAAQTWRKRTLNYT